MALTEDEELELLQLERERAIASGQFKPQASAKPSLMGRAWDVLKVPEQKSREGLQMLAGMVPKPEPTGNLPLDLAVGAPRVAADTMAEAAPGFISRGSLVTGGLFKGLGAARQATRAIGRGVARNLESASGLEHRAPGVLREAFKDPTLLFAKGKEAASKAFKVVKEAAGSTKSLTEDLLSHKNIVEKAQELSKAGQLSAAEAHVARRSVDALMKSKEYSRDALLEARKLFNKVVKADPAFAKADKMYERAVKAEGMRNVFPQNKLGGASPFRAGIGSAMLMMPGGKVLAPLLLSPFVQGATATGLGIGARAASPLLSKPSLAGAGTAVTDALVNNQFLQSLLKGKKKAQ
jgi:hypothetical protein